MGNAEIGEVQMPVFDCEDGGSGLYGRSGGLLVSAWAGKLDSVAAHLAEHPVTDPAVLFATENETSVPSAARIHVYSLPGVLGGSDAVLSAPPCLP